MSTANNSSGGGGPGSTGGGGSGGMGSHLQSALLGLSRRQVLDSSKLTPLHRLDDAYDKALKQQAREEALRRREAKVESVRALDRSHPHSHGLDLVKIYATSPVAAPDSLVKAKQHRERAQLTPTERLFQKHTELSQSLSQSRDREMKMGQAHLRGSPGARGAGGGGTGGAGGNHSPNGRSYSTPLFATTSSASPESTSKLPPLHRGSGFQVEESQRTTPSFSSSSPTAAAKKAPPRLSPGDLDSFSVEDRGTSTYTVPVTKNRRVSSVLGFADPDPQGAEGTKQVTKRWTTVAIQVVPTKKKKPKAPAGDASPEKTPSQ
jgi:hypothetical protein